MKDNHAQLVAIARRVIRAHDDHDAGSRETAINEMREIVRNEPIPKLYPPSHYVIGVYRGKLGMWQK